MVWASVKRNRYNCKASSSNEPETCGLLDALIHPVAFLSAAIVLLVLGVSKETIMEDYLLSNTYRAQEMQRELSDFRRKQAPAQDGLKARRDEQLFQSLIEARREYLQAAFDEMIKEYGSIAAYIRNGLGVSKAQQKQLQNQLLE